MIHLQGLGFAYRRSSTLFNGLDLDLPAGTICGMLGSNGAGKSTLLKVLAGLLRPQQGVCQVLGQVPAMRLPSFLADLYLLPEEVHVPALAPTEYEKRYAAFYPRFDHAMFGKLLAEFALPMNRELNELSLGQKKKFLLAFGIATNTRLLIMDEPTNGLDIPGKAQFRRILLEHFEPTRSFIISTHQVHDLERLIDSVLILADGRILLHETLDALSTRLCMELEYEAPVDALYSEEGLDGHRVLRANRAHVESRIDLGLLFGFVTTRTAAARVILAQGVPA